MSGDARTSADWLHLRDALRDRCTGCDALTSADWVHLHGSLHRAPWLQLQAQTSADWLHLRGSARCALVAVASAGNSMLLTEGF
jgi:hypothetical protein